MGANFRSEFPTYTSGTPPPQAGIEPVQGVFLGLAKRGLPFIYSNLFALLKYMSLFFLQIQILTMLQKIKKIQDDV